MAEPTLGAGLPDRMDGRYRLQGQGILQGDQQDRPRGRRLAQGREKGSIGAVAGQERIGRFLDVCPYRHEGPWHRGHPDHGHRQPERLYRYHQERLPRIQDPDMRGAPDPQRMPLRGLEGQKGIHRRHEGHLQCSQPEGCQGRSGGLCQEMGSQVLLRDKELEGELGRADRVLRVPRGDTTDYLYHQPYRKPQWEDQKIYQEQAVLPNGRRGDEIRIFGHQGGHKEVVHANQELGNHPKSVPYDL